jgi:hypothetical protein
MESLLAITDGCLKILNGKGSVVTDGGEVINPILTNT